MTCSTRMKSMGLVAALMLAVLAPSPVSAAQTVRLERARWSLDLHVPDGPGRHPVVIILPGCTGNSPEQITRGLHGHVAALNSKGIAAGILDVFTKRGIKSICANLPALLYLERQAARDAVSALGAMADTPGVDASRAGFLGQSFGGSVALRLASRSKRPKGAAAFSAISAYYPYCFGRYGQKSGSSDFAVPLLIMTGDADTWTPASRCTTLKPEPGTRRARVRTYTGAVHSFDAIGLKLIRIPSVNGMHAVGSSPAARRASIAHYLGFFGGFLR